jgi:hypothetical protein
MKSLLVKKKSPEQGKGMKKRLSKPRFGTN